MSVTNPLATPAYFLIAIIMLLISSPRWSLAEDSTGAEAPLLEQIEVTVPPQSERSASVTIINKDAMEGKHGPNLNDVLFSGTPGVFTARRSELGFSGPNSGFFIRGLNGPRVAVFIDGIPTQVNNHFHPRVDQYSSDLIHRLEITRGPSVIKHGPSAVGGVIDIFTRNPGKGASGFIQGAGGEEDSHELLGDLGFGWSSGSVLFSGTDRKTDGQALGEGHDELNRNFKLSQQLNDTWTLGFRAANTREFAHDARSSDPTEVIFKFTQDLTTYVASLDRKTENSSSLIAFHYNDLETGSFRVSGAAGRFRDRDRIEQEQGFLAKHTWLRGGGNTVTLGFNSVEFSDENPKGSSEDDESYFSPYIHASQAITDTVRVDGGLRFTDSSQFDTDVSPEVGIVKKLNDSLALRARAGQTFRVPRVNEVVNNDNLDVEEFDHAEIGVNKIFHIANNIEFDAVVWWMDGDNLIVNDFNTGDFTHTGIETYLNIPVTNQLEVFFASTFMDLEEASNTPERTFDAGVDFRHGRWRGTLTGHQSWSNANEDLDDYFVADARVTYKFANDLEFFVDVDNINNKRFSTFQGRFGGPVENIRRTVFVGSRYRFGN